MADGVEFKAFVEPFYRFVDDRRARMDKAAVWALRQAARAGTRAARQAAPVLQDRTRSSHAQLQRYRRRGFDVSKSYERPVPGLLKASIRVSRHARRVGPHEFTIKFGPWGQRAHLYARKEENRVNFMDRGQAAAEAAVEVVAVEAFRKVWKA